MVAVTVACDTKAQCAPSPPPADGFRVEDGVLKLWTGNPCDGVTGLTLTFDSGTQESTEQVWTAPRPGVLLERMDLLRTAGATPPDTLGPLQVQKPLPADYDWTKAGSIAFSVDGPTAYGARVDVAQVLRESAQHPSGSRLFGQRGWMDVSDVQRENQKSFLTVGTPDPALQPAEPNMDTPDNAARTSALRTALRRLVLGAFACTAILIVLLVGEAVLSATGLSSDPHGYGMFAGVLFAAVLIPIALALWLLYRSMRRRRK